MGCVLSSFAIRCTNFPCLFLAELMVSYVEKSTEKTNKPTISEAIPISITICVLFIIKIFGAKVI